MPFTYQRYLVLTVVLVLSFTSCKQDDFSKLSTKNWDPEIAIPLIDSRLGVDRVIKQFEGQGFLTTDSEKVVTVVYNGNIFDVRAEEVFQLADLSFDLAQIQGRLPFAMPKMQLSTIDVKNGLMHVHAQSSEMSDVEVTLFMPETTKGGEPFTQTFTIPYSGSPTSAFDTVYSMAGYRFNLSGESGTERNELFIKHVATRKSDQRIVILDFCLVRFDDLEFSFLDGYLGKLKIGAFNDSMQVQMFNNFKSGTILLEDPRFAISIENGFGMPVNTTIKSLNGTGTGGSENLSGPAVVQGIEVSAASKGSGPAESRSEFNNSNSNITNFLAITPTTINFEFLVDANVDSDPSNYNFAYDTSRLKGDLFLELPLKGSLDSVIFEDLYEFNSYETENIEVALFKIHTKNQFPLGVYFQLYFMDRTGSEIDSLIQDNDVILKEAVTDAKGFAVIPSVEESYFTIGKQRFESIKDQTTHLKLRAMLLTDGSDEKTIRITSSDYFHIRVGVRAVVTVNQ